MADIAIVGAGFVGLINAVGLAELGHHVAVIEADENKVESLSRDRMPVYEPDLQDLWQAHRKAGTIHITASYTEALADRQFCFIAVGTPAGLDGVPDLRNFYAAVDTIVAAASNPLTIVIKSTVPVGTAEQVQARMALPKNGSRNAAPVVSNPEFLSEGRGVSDFFHPDRIIIGSDSREVGGDVAQLYAATGVPEVFCDNRTAEMIKYVSNAFLATKISLINEIAWICEHLKVDVNGVAAAVGMDNRIGPAFLRAGLGWGGSCFPKDLTALSRMASQAGVSHDVLDAVATTNHRQPRMLVDQVKDLLGTLDGKTIGVLGLSFKPGTNDLRDSPSISLTTRLQTEGCIIRAYDPKAMDDAAGVLSGVTFCASAYETARGCDAVVLATDWPEFKELDLKKLGSLMKQPVFLDGRNMFDPQEASDAGLIYSGVGRGHSARLGRIDRQSVHP